MTALSKQKTTLSPVELKTGPLSIQVCVADDTKPGIEKNGLTTDALPEFLKKPNIGKHSLACYRHIASMENNRTMDSARLWRPVSGVQPLIGSPNSDELRIHALVIDTRTHVTLSHLKKKLAGTFAVLHTRYGHSPSQEEWRVIIPFKDPAPWDDWFIANKHWQDILGITNVKTNMRGDNWHGLPMVAPEVQEHYQVVALEGTLFNVTSFNSLNHSDAKKFTEANPADLDDEFSDLEYEPSKPSQSPPPAPYVVKQSTTATPEKSTKGAITLSPSPTLAAAPRPFPTAYSFPVRAATTATIDNESLKRTLCDLASKITDLHEYFKIRHEWCELHLKISKRGLWAPGFRPWPKLPQKPRDQCADHDHAIQRDRLVIETHWLHSQKKLVNVDLSRETWIPLFDHAAPFDFDLAERFALQVWTDQHRTSEVLCLTPFQQCQMFSLRTDRMKAHMASFSKSTRGPNNRSISSRRSVIRNALAQWKERQPNLGNLERLLSRAEAKYYLGEAASATQVAQLAGFITGSKSQDAKTVSQSLKRLKDWLPSTAPTAPNK